MLAPYSGILDAADWRSGVCRIQPDSTETLFTCTIPDGLLARPNGIALLPDGSFFMAQLGDNEGAYTVLPAAGRSNPG